MPRKGFACGCRPAPCVSGRIRSLTPCSPGVRATPQRRDGRRFGGRAAHAGCRTHSPASTRMRRRPADRAPVSRRAAASDSRVRRFARASRSARRAETSLSASRRSEVPAPSARRPGPTSGRGSRRWTLPRGGRSSPRPDNSSSVRRGGASSARSPTRGGTRCGCRAHRQSCAAVPAILRSRRSANPGHS